MSSCGVPDQTEGGRMALTIMRWKVMVIVLFYCSLHMAATQYCRKALYPSAFRVKRGTSSLVNPTFQSSVKDVTLLFEILLAGLQMEDDKPFSIEDEELSSLRKVQTLEVICTDILPKKLSDIRRLTSALSQRRGSLYRADFERTVLTMVYTTQRLAHTTTDHQRERWAEALLQLYKALKADLTLK